MRTIIRKHKRVLILLLFLLLLPSFAMLVLGYQFNDQVLERIPFGILDYDNSSMSRTLVQMIEENNAFDVKIYAESDEQIEESLQKGTIAASIIIPKGFQSDISASDRSPILAIYDNVQLSAAGTAKAKITEILSTLNMGTLSSALQSGLKLSSEQTAAMLQPLKYTVQQINPGRSSVLFSMHGTMLNMVQICVFILALEITRKQDGKQPHLVIRNSIIYGLLGTISAGFVVLLQVKVFHFPFHGSTPAYVLILFLYLVAIAGLGILVRLLSKDKDSAVQKVSMVMLMLLLSGYSYPLTSMPKVLQLLGNLIPFAHYAVPLRDIMLMGYSLRDVLDDLQWIMGFLILIWIGLLILCASKNEIDIFKNSNGNKKTVLTQRAGGGKKC